MQRYNVDPRCFPPPFKGLNIRILIIIPMKGRGLLSRGSGLGSGVDESGLRCPLQNILEL